MYLCKLLLLMCMLFLMSCSKQPPTSTEMNIEQIIIDNEMKCNLVLEVVHLHEEEDILFFCDESDNIRASYVKNIKNDWTLQRSSAISKNSPNDLEWSYNLFRDAALTVNYQVVWGIFWDENIKRVEIELDKENIQADIVGINQDYHLWVYVFPGVEETIPPVMKKVIGYDKDDNILYSFP